jgi:acetylornithine deacetylase/succinyl-diaminopimelate desuccinylase-like protein
MLRLVPRFVLIASVLTCGRESSQPTETVSSPNTAPIVTRPAADLIPGLPLDPDILAMVAEVDPEKVAANIQTLVGFENRNTCSDNSGSSPGIGAARDWIQSQFAALPGVEVRLDPWTFARCPDGSRTLHNVIAWIPGTGHPDRLIVIGGHYDSRNTNTTDGANPAPGANDSGSQAALVLEVARVLSRYSFDATVVFAAWSGEEQGLYGSSAFVNGSYRNYFPDGRLELNLTADIVGGDNTVNDAAALQQFRLYSPGTPREISSQDGSSDDTSPSRGIMRYIGYWGGLYVPTMTMIPKLREDRVNRGSDHKSFIGKGIPGVRFIDVNENVAHQHSPDDLYEYVTPAYTARVVQVVAASAASLARAPTPPQSLSVQRLSGRNLKLSWAPPSSGPVDHYVVSTRSVSENLYRIRLVVPNDVISTTLNLVDDLGILSGNSYISVAAVDAAGHESLYAYPEFRCSTRSCSVPSGSLSVTATR